MKTIRSPFVFTIVLTGFALMPSQSLAQGEAMIEEILVTAQKREQAITDVPLSIEALSQDNLDKANIAGIRELIIASPKLKAMSNFSQGASVLTARGIVGSTNLDPTVSTYVDDIPIGMAGSGWAPSGNMYDTSRVEILGGPQGTLYGQGALAGTMRIFTNDPDTQEASASIELGYADVTDGDEDFNYSGVVNIPVVQDKLAARASYSKREEGGFFDGLSFLTGPIDDYNEADYEDIRVKVLATPTEDLTIKGTYWQSTVRSPLSDAAFGGIFSLILGSASPRENIGWIELGQNNSDLDAWSINVDYDFGPVTVTNTYSEIDYDFLQNQVAAISDGFADQRSNQTTNEFRVASDFDGPFQFIAGHFYLDGHNGFDLQIGLPLPTFFFLGLNRVSIDSEVSAFFGEATYELFDGRVTLLAGIRDFTDDRDFFQAVSAVDPLPNPTFGPATNRSEKFSKTTKRFNIAVQPLEDQDWMVFFNYGQGFRSGHFNPQIAVDGATLAGFPGDVEILGQDVNTSYDLGTKYTHPSGRFSAELTAFWSELEGAQTSIDFTGGARLFAATFINAGDLDVFGIDYALTFRPTDSLSFDFQGAYLDTEWGNLLPLIDQFSGLAEGGPATGVPKHQFIAAATYTRPVDWWGGLEFTGYLDYRYESSSTDTTGVPGNVAPKHDKLNLRLTLARAGSWAASLYVDNLTDEDDVISTAFNGFNTVWRPRQIGLNFRKDFTF